MKIFHDNETPTVKSSQSRYSLEKKSTKKRLSSGVSSNHFAGRLAVFKVFDGKTKTVQSRLVAHLPEVQLGPPTTINFTAENWLDGDSRNGLTCATAMSFPPVFTTKMFRPTLSLKFTYLT